MKKKMINKKINSFFGRLSNSVNLVILKRKIKYVKSRYRTCGYCLALRKTSSGYFCDRYKFHVSIFYSCKHFVPVSLYKENRDEIEKAQKQVFGMFEDMKKIMNWFSGGKR